MKILITGASGSFGTALCQALLADGAAEKIVAMARSEHGLARLAERLGHPPELKLLVGDVRDPERVAEALTRVDTIVAAAALKRVDAVNHDPREIFHTNYLGIVNVVRAAALRNVPRILLVSSDKASQPSTIYGASKLAAEFYAVFANHLGHPRSRISVVRWGNVLGSRGSVVWTWQRQARQGLPLSLTHAGMTRFWITMPQAVAFARQALADMAGGEVFIPALPAGQMTDLAEALCPGADVKITGLRGGGEKLAETLLSEDESPRAVQDGDRFVLEPAFAAWPRRPWPGRALPPGFRYRSDAAPRLSVAELRTLLETVPEEEP